MNHLPIVPILLPLILVLSAVGTYAIENNPVHIYWMLGFGVLGYFLKMYGFQVGPVILGIILGPLIDVSYRRAMISASSPPAIHCASSSPTRLRLASTIPSNVSRSGWLVM